MKKNLSEIRKGQINIRDKATDIPKKTNQKATKTISMSRVEAPKEASRVRTVVNGREQW